MNKAIIVLVVLILLAFIISWTQRDEMKPDLEPKSPPVTSPVAPPVNQVERAKREVALLDEALSAARYGLQVGEKHPITESWDQETAQASREVLKSFRDFIERVPQWRAPIQRVAEGDSSGVAAMEEAISQWNQSYDELTRKIEAMPGGSHRQTLGMTREGYEALATDMRKMEVDLVLGCAGVERSRTGNLVIYTWKQGLVNVTATFENGKLISKAQFGL